MNLIEGDIIGIVLQKSELGETYALVGDNVDISNGQLFIIQDEQKISIGRVENYMYINEFFDEDAEIVKGIIRDKFEIYDILKSNTLIKVTLSIIKKFNHNTLPRPGSILRKLPDYDNEEFLLNFYNVSSLNGFIKYGTLAGSKIPLLLDINGLTMHVGIFGETGSGKSYNVRYLIYLLSNIIINGKVTAYPLIVIDANGDYNDLTNFNKNMMSNSRKMIKKYVIKPINYKINDDEIRLTIDLSKFTPREMAEFILALKYGDVSYNQLQLNLLEYVLSNKDNKEYNQLLGTENGIQELQKEIIDLVKENKDLGFTYSTARSVISALEIFKNKIIKKLSLISKNSTFSEDTLELLWYNKGLVIFDFSADGSPGIDILTKQLIVSYLARVMLNYLTTMKYSGNQRFIGLIIEEAQNYIPSNDYPINAKITKDVLVTLATQGRKFGASIILVSQRPAFIDKYVLSMLNTMFFHRIYHEDVRYVMSATGGLPEALARSLNNLDIGYTIVTGIMNALKSPVLVKIPWISMLGNYTGALERVEKVLISD
jgi:DNA helicase HerA-like ATPase